MVILRFDPKTVICGLQRARRKAPSLPSSLRSSDGSDGSFSRMAVLCEKLMSLVSQQDFMR